MEQAASFDTSGVYPRRAHKKSRKGCKNCKARKVKCDEQRPLCGPCAKHYINIERCEYELPAEITSSRRIAVSNPVENPQSSQVTIPETIGGDVLDPFQTYPQTPINNPNILLRHYLSTVVVRSFPFFNTKAIIDLWWPFLREDELLFNVILCLSAVSLEALQHDESQALSVRLMMECISLLRVRVEDSSHGASDETIIAVSNLMAIEHTRGNVRSVKMHMDGLKRMVVARGGLDALRSSNPMVANIAFWMSMVASNQSHSLPIAYDSDDRLHLFPDDIALSNIGSSLSSADEVRDMILQEANHMSQMFTVTVQSSSTEEGLSVLDHLSSLIQALIQLAPKHEVDPITARLLESCRYAAALHVFFPLCGYYPDPTLMVHTMVYDLKASLDFYAVFLTLHTDLVLWMFFVGGVSACNMTERNWFVEHLVVMTEDLEIRTWDQMRSHLTSVVWYAVFCEVSFKTLWLEIEAKSRALSTAEQVL